MDETPRDKSKKPEQHDDDNGPGKTTAPEADLAPLRREKTRPDISYLREYAFILATISSQLFTQAGLGVNIPTLPQTGRTFGVTNPGQLSWTAAAFSLTVGTFILPAGRVGESFGHKPVYVAGLLWYAVWSMAAGLSGYTGSIVFFDFCRAMQGIGPSFMLPNAIAILGSTYPPGRRKEFIFGIFGATAPSGFNLAAIFASLLTSTLGWQWGYYILAVACCVLAAFAWLVVPEGDNVSAHLSPDFDVWRLDPAGTLTGVAGLVLFNFAWNQGPVVGWPTPYVYALLVVGSAVIAVFFGVEMRVRHPLVPIRRMDAKSLFVLGCIMAGWASFGIWLYYLWQFALNLRHQTALRSAVQFLVCSVSGLVASVTTGLTLSRVRPSVLMLVSMLGFMLGNVLLATQPVDQTFWAQTFVSLLVMPFGMDISFPAATVLMSDFFPRGEQGTAASLVNTVLNYSISIGLGIAGTIESNVEPTGQDLLRGYRSAWYFGLSIAALGVVVALVFCVVEVVQSRRSAAAAKKEPGDTTPAEKQLERHSIDDE